MDCPTPAVTSPFLRPWMAQTGAAAPAGGGNIGLKGIIAGNVINGEIHRDLSALDCSTVASFSFNMPTVNQAVL